MSEYIGAPAYVGNWWGAQPSQVVPWAGNMDWGNMDWTSLYGNAAGGGPEAISWFNALLPWFQQSQAQQQFGTQMDYQRWLAQQQDALSRWATQGGWTQEQWLQNAQRDWAREEQQNQLDYERWARGGQWDWEREQQRAQLEYERWATGGGWEQEKYLQQQQAALERELSRTSLESQERQTAMTAFGHRWMPNTRWT